MDTAPEPTPRRERIAMLDTTRGIAVLGILLMNIIGFGLPYAYEDPTNWGGAEGLDLIAWWIAAVFFEGTMRGLFTLLFGAGVLLLLERQLRASPGSKPTGLYFRRTLWLIVFGLINGYVLVWPGDILFVYGLTGLVLFAFRGLSARLLFAIAAVIMLVQTTITVVEWVDFTSVKTEAEAARVAQVTGAAPETTHQEAIEAYEAVIADFKPPRSDLEAIVFAVRASYLSAARTMAPETWYSQTEYLFRHMLFESLSMMLLGMALLKLGVLSGAAPVRLYALFAIGGYAIGLPVNVFEANRLVEAGLTVEALMDSYLTYDLGRIPMTLGHLGVIGLFCHTRALEAIARVFASVGRMALTNYLMQSVIALFVFTGAGLALFGQLDRHELYYVVAAIWLVQLIASPLWLRHFRFGPAEWLWRSLTYGHRQPMRRTPRSSGVEKLAGGEG